ncbi:MAG: hypothetical protein HC880_17590 [Bacteroidia bacterium]|nr:hypothetical protein [Bacteroidia bacterium]
MFQSFKTRGFDLESTRFKHPARLHKLIGLVALAFGLCQNLGIYYDQKVQKIKIKKQGYKAHRFCRVGID